MGARAAVAGFVAIGLVVGGAYLADGLARDEAEGQVADVITRELQVEGTPEVRIGGFPFLTQLLAGSLDDVTAAAGAVTLDGLRVTDVTVDAADVSLAAPYRVGDLRIDATVPTASIEQVVRDTADLDVTVGGGALRASGEVLGLTLTAGLVPRVEDGRLLVDVQDVTLGAGTLRLDQLPGNLAERLVGIEVPLDGLPPGIVLQDAQVVPDGVRVTATGVDVVLEEAR